MLQIVCANENLEKNGMDIKFQFKLQTFYDEIVIFSFKKVSNTNMHGDDKNCNATTNGFPAGDCANFIDTTLVFTLPVSP